MNWNAWHAYRLVRLLFLLVGLAVGLSGCAILLSALGLGEPRFTLDSADIVGLPVITEQELAQMLAARLYMPAPAGVRMKAMTASAVLNEPSVHGVAVRAGVPLAADSQLFVVARAIDAGSLPGQLRAKSVFVAALSGIEVPAFGRVVLAATREDGSPVQLSHTLAALECSVLPGPQGSAALGAGAGADAGLPSAVRINAESSALPRNGTGDSVAVHIFPSGRLGLPSNRFVCARAKAVSTERTPMQAAGAARWPVGPGAVLMSEQQFQTWSAFARRSPFDPAASTDLREAATLVTSANHFAVRGIEGQRGRWWQQDPQRSPKLLVVARDLQLEGGRARATDFFVVPVWWDGPPPIPLPGVATDLFLDFGALLPRFDVRLASCSPLMLPFSDLECRAGACSGLPGLSTSILNLGGDRLERGLPRSTLHWHNVFPVRTGFGLDLPQRPNFDVHVAACSMTWTPPVRFVPGCGFNEWTGQPYLEICNGRDDNCDGQIDEGNTCDVSQPQQCPAQPPSCGTTTCGSIPDGCGNAIRCGGPCP